MRFKLKIGSMPLSDERIVSCHLYTKTDEEHEKESYQSGVYHSACTISDNVEILVHTIESCINACINGFEEGKK